MANLDSFSRHPDLVANAVATVTVPDNQVEVVNRGTVDVFFTISGVDPVLKGNNTKVVTPGGALLFTGSENSTEVRLIASAACPVTVQSV